MAKLLKSAVRDSIMSDVENLIKELQVEKTRDKEKPNRPVPKPIDKDSK